MKEESPPLAYQVSRQYIAENHPERLAEFEEDFGIICEAAQQRLQKAAAAQRSHGREGLPFDLSSFAAGSLVSSVIWTALVCLTELRRTLSARRLSESIQEISSKGRHGIAVGHFSDRQMLQKVAQGSTRLAVREMASDGIRPIDLDIGVTSRKENGQTVLDYSLTSPSGEADCHHKRIDGIRLKRNPEEYRNLFVQRIEQLRKGRGAGRSQLLREEVEDKLQSLGHSLYEELFPFELRQIYGRIREAVRTVQITTDEPWIPWELVKPYDDSQPGDLIDDDFLCVQFEFARWLAGDRTAPWQIPIRRLAVVGCADPPGLKPLKGVEKERRLLAGFAASTPGLEDASPEQATREAVIRLLETADADWLHFTGHGAFDSDEPGLSGIHLADDQLFSAEDLHGSRATRIKTQNPLVFINACQSGQQGWSLTALDGWAPRWVRNCHCSAFVSPLWNVSDASAYSIAEAFYEGILKGKTFGAAFQAARQKLRSQGSLDWLSYCLYAHPCARLVLPRA